MQYNTSQGQIKMIKLGFLLILYKVEVKNFNLAQLICFLLCGSKMFYQEYVIAGKYLKYLIGVVLTTKKKYYIIDVKVMQGCSGKASECRKALKSATAGKENYV